MLAASGAMLAAASVALAAYAAHATGEDRLARLPTAAAFAFGHGLALAALAPSARGLAFAATTCLLAGTVLFSGSLVAAHFFGWSTALAPWGGLLLIGGWSLYAVASLGARGSK